MTLEDRVKRLEKIVMGSQKDDLENVSQKFNDVYAALPETFKATEGYKLVKKICSERTFYDFLKNKLYYTKVDKTYKKCKSLKESEAFWVILDFINTKQCDAINLRKLSKICEEISIDMQNNS